MDTIILFSAGRESLYNLYKELKTGSEIKLLLFNYGQKSFKKEKKSLEYYAAKYKLQSIILRTSIKIPTAISKATNEDNHVVLRNFIFIGLAINYFGAYNKYLFGANKTEKYNDGSTEFVKDIAYLIKKLYPTAIINSHSKNIKTEEVLIKLVKSEFDISHIWFCDNNKEKMCGECFKCKIEIRLLKDNHLKYYQKVKQLWQ